MGDREVNTVLLDSVQSQANRMELALLAAYERREIALPLVVSDFSPWFPKVGRITALEAPHRVYDAIFRDATIDGVRFRETQKGRQLYEASLQNATPLLRLCPTALVFGAWDSTSLRPGYTGAKFERCLTSEIVGFNAVPGKKTGSRIDPLSIVLVATIYKTADGWWTADENKAERDAQGKPILYSKKNGDKPGRPSLINHGNITPTIADGGYTIARAEQVTVLSLIALRRLRFPSGEGANGTEGRWNPSTATDFAAQILLASLALCAIAYQRQEGYDLRSRCVLIPSAPAHFEILGTDLGQVQKVTLDAAGARGLFNQAVQALPRELGWDPKKFPLEPSDDVLRLIEKSRELDEELDGEGA